MGERAISELFESEFLSELCAAADRAALLEADKGNVATAVVRLAQAETRGERYNEGLNALATILAWLAVERPSDHLMIQNDGLRELRRMVRSAA
jgi:hypothetical protein